MTRTVAVDVLIIGGGIAGLWTLDVLRRQGYSAILAEKTALGTGQTISAQGILHGGFKHAFGGRKRELVQALNSMPSVWAQHFKGLQEPDLRTVRLRASECVCWHTGGIVNRLAQTIARLGLHATPAETPAKSVPLPLQQVAQMVYTLGEQVVDPGSLLEVLSARNQEYLVWISGLHPQRVTSGVWEFVLRPRHGGTAVCVRPRTAILTAGSGNGALRAGLGLSSDIARQVPLPILVVRGDLPTLNGFCLEGTHAKAIVTTHRVSPHHAIWQVACEGVDRLTGAAFEQAAWQELQDALPGFVWPEGVQRTSYVVERAEPSGSAMRSNDAFVQKDGDVITAWPTKLVLAPRVSTKIHALLPSPAQRTDVPGIFRGWLRPPVAVFPW